MASSQQLSAILKYVAAGIKPAYECDIPDMTASELRRVSPPQLAVVKVNRLFIVVVPFFSFNLYVAID